MLDVIEGRVEENFSLCLDVKKHFKSNSKLSQTKLKPNERKKKILKPILIFSETLFSII